MFQTLSGTTTNREREREYEQSKRIKSTRLENMENLQCFRQMGLVSVRVGVTADRVQAVTGGHAIHTINPLAYETRDIDRGPMWGGFTRQT